MPADLRIVRRRTSRFATARAERSTSSLDCAHARLLGGEHGVLGDQLVATARLEHEEVDSVEDALRARDHGFGRRHRRRVAVSTTPASAASARQRSSSDASAIWSASASARRREVRRSRVVERLVEGAQHRQPILQSGQLRRIDPRIAGPAPLPRLGRATPIATARQARQRAGGGGEPPKTRPVVAASTRWACASPAAAGARDPATRHRRDAEDRVHRAGRLQLGKQLVDDLRRQAAQPGRRDLAAKRRLASVVTAGPARGPRNRDQLAAQALRPLADVGIELAHARRSRRCPAAIACAPRSRIGRSRSTAACQRASAPSAFDPRLRELAAERGHLGLDVERESRVGRGGLDLGHPGTWPRAPSRPGARGESRPRQAFRRCVRARPRPSAPSRWPGSRRGAARRSWSTATAASLVRASARLRSSVRSRAVATPSGTRGAPLGSHPVHRLADADQGLGRGHASARVREPLDRLLELSGALACAFGRVDAEAVVTEPRGRAENRLVDAQMEAAGGDRAPAAQLVGQLRSPELEHLDGLLARVEAPGDADATSVVELVGQREAVASSRPGLVARPVAAIDRATLAASIDAVQRPAHRTQQRRLA